jgi:hypothetical protein
MMCALALALLALPVRDAGAHIMPAGQGSTRIVGNRAHTLVAIPVAALRGFDDDRDGLLGRDELARHGRALEEQCRTLVRITSKGRAGTILYLTLLVEHADSANAPMATITLMRVDEWKEPVERIAVRADLFRAGADSLLMRAIYSVPEPTEPGAPPRVRDLRTEQAILGARRRQHGLTSGPVTSARESSRCGGAHRATAGPSGAGPAAIARSPQGNRRRSRAPPAIPARR